MTFLSPAAFWFLLVFVPLLWLWRFNQSRRTLVIPSLAPFRHLREQLPKSQWVRVNVLLLLQILLLLALIGALARPLLQGKLFARPRQTIVVVLDNSASMRASSAGATAFVRARSVALRVAGSLAAHDRLLVVATTPPQLVTPQWVSDAGQARAVVYRVELTDAAGDLAGAIQLAQSMTGEQGVDRFVVATDEPTPRHALPKHVEWHAVGHPLPNAALTQFELSHALAENVALTASIEVANFAETPQDIEVTLVSGSMPVAKQTVRVGAAGRQAVVLGPFTLPVAESLTAAIRAPHDALTADNTSIMTRHGPAQAGVVLEQLPSQLARTFERLIRGTTSLRLAGAEVTGETPPIHVTYGAPTTEPKAPTLYVWPADGRGKSQPVRVVDWDASHPVTRFLTSADRLPLVTARDGEWPAWARPVVWGSDGRRSMPLVGVAERAGFREVVMSLGLETINFEDPRAVELLILLLNTCHWLAPSSQALRVPTGTALTMAYLPPGDYTVTLPTGESQRLTHPGGAWEFADTWWAGSYRVAGPAAHWQFHAALHDERESNILHAASSIPEGIWPQATPVTATRASPRPVDRWLWWLAALLFIAEWFVYQRRILARSAT